MADPAHCPTCGHAVKVVGDTTQHYEPTGCLRIEDQACDEQLHHLRSLLTRVSDWFDNPDDEPSSSELVDLINEALA